MTGERHSVSGEGRLRESKDKQVSVRWPVALDQRLDDLVARAYQAGEDTNRRQLLAALLFHADPTGEELREILQRYRLAQVKDAPLEQVEAQGDLLQFPNHKPGPRTAG